VVSGSLQSLRFRLIQARKRSTTHCLGWTPRYSRHGVSTSSIHVMNARTRRDRLLRCATAHLGLLPPECAEPPRGNGQILELPGSSAFVFATMDGIFEPFHAKGRDVRAGEPAGRIHCTWDPTRPSETLHYQADGMLFGRRQQGRVRPGNCCLVVAASYGGELDATA
jgi:predicted deacylase